MERRLRRIVCCGVGWGPKKGKIEFHHDKDGIWKVGNGFIATIPNLPTDDSDESKLKALDMIEMKEFGRTFSDNE